MQLTPPPIQPLLLSCKEEVQKKITLFNIKKCHFFCLSQWTIPIAVASLSIASKSSKFIKMRFSVAYSAHNWDLGYVHWATSNSAISHWLATLSFYLFLFRNLKTLYSKLCWTFLMAAADFTTTFLLECLNRI